MRAVYQFSTVVLALTMTATAALGQDQMPWQPNLETAQRVAAQSNRLVLIHFWAPWCRPCMRLEQEVFSRAETGKQLEANFVMVKLNADDAPGTTRLYGVSSLPTDVITTPSGRLVSQVQSPPSASQYVQQMNQVAAGHRSLAQARDAKRPTTGPRPIAERRTATDDRSRLRSTGHTTAAADRGLCRDSVPGSHGRTAGRSLCRVLSRRDGPWPCHQSGHAGASLWECSERCAAGLASSGGRSVCRTSSLGRSVRSAAGPCGGASRHGGSLCRAASGGGPLRRASQFAAG